MSAGGFISLAAVEIGPGEAGKGNVGGVGAARHRWWHKPLLADCRGY